MIKDDLTELRNKIDDVDSTLISCWEKRMSLSEEVARFKHKNGKPVLDTSREVQLLDSLVDKLDNRSLENEVRELYKCILKLSRLAQQKVLDAAGAVVAYQGIPGAFAEECVYRRFTRDCAAVPCKTFEDVFEMVADGRVQWGVLPMENSTSGSIDQIYDLLAQNNVFISGEEVINVRHYLFGLENSSLSSISRVFSHEQGYLQCKSFFKAHPGLEFNVYHNTAMSARYVASKKDITCAAIANKRAGEVYGLKVLAEGIQDLKNNQTRFIVISSQLPPDPEAKKISIMFSLRHQSGALQKALAVLSNINLTGLYSRPVWDKPWEYRFFADIEGNLLDEELLQTLELMKKECIEWRILGNFRECKLERTDAGSAINNPVNL